MARIDWADLNGPCRPTAEGSNFKTCPVCADDNWHLYVNENTGKWFCHSGSHGAGGSLAGYAQYDPDALLDQLQTELDPPTRSAGWDWPEIPVNADERMACLNEDGTRGDGLIPMYDDVGRCIYWTHYFPWEQPKYINAPGKHPLFVPNWDEGRRAVIVEGPFDALRVAQAGYRGIALLGKKLPARLQADLMYALGGDAVPYIMLDGDAAGEAHDISEWLVAQPGIINANMVFLQSNDDPGNLDLREIKRLLEGY